MALPALPSLEVLTDLYKEAAQKERVSPVAVEKDFLFDPTHLDAR
jgi:hypothetical protein